MEREEVFFYLSGVRIEISFNIADTIATALSTFANHTDVSIPLLGLALSPYETSDNDDLPLITSYTELRALSNTVIVLSSYSISPFIPIITKLENIIEQSESSHSGQSLMQQCLLTHAKKLRRLV